MKLLNSNLVMTGDSDSSVNMEMEELTLRLQDISGRQLEHFEMGCEDGDCGGKYEKTTDRKKKREFVTMRKMGNTSATGSTSPRVMCEITRRVKGRSTRTTRGSLMLRTEDRFVGQR